MPTAKSLKYPFLQVPSAGVRFRDGEAEVSEAQAKQLRALPESSGVSVAEPKPPRKPREDTEE